MITVLVVIIVGAICLGVGYLLGKKSKVKTQIKNVIDKI